MTHIFGRNSFKSDRTGAPLIVLPRGPQTLVHQEPADLVVVTPLSRSAPQAPDTEPMPAAEVNRLSGVLGSLPPGHVWGMKFLAEGGGNNAPRQPPETIAVRFDPITPDPFAPLASMPHRGGVIVNTPTFKPQPPFK